jgi:kynurenine formamidase
VFEYREIVDLTLPITTGMEIPPGLKKTAPKVEFEVFRTHEEHGIRIGIFRSVIHAGTHLDSPLHNVAGGTSIDEMPLSQWLGPAYCVSIPGVGPNQGITVDDIASRTPRLDPGMILLIHTGWSDKMFGVPEYWSESPYLTPDAAQWLVDNKVKLAGFDFFQDEGAKATSIRPEDFRVHRIMLRNGCMNVEHLTNLGKIAGKKVFFIGLPLKIVGAEGSPTRAIALL